VPGAPKGVRLANACKLLYNYIIMCSTRHTAVAIGAKRDSIPNRTIHMYFFKVGHTYLRNLAYLTRTQPACLYGWCSSRIAPFRLFSMPRLLRHRLRRRWWWRHQWRRRGRADRCNFSTAGAGWRLGRRRVDVHVRRAWPRRDDGWRLRSSRRVGPCRVGLAVTAWWVVDRAAALGCAPSSDRGLGRAWQWLERASC
jgi:hypothetical protein